MPLKQLDHAVAARQAFGPGHYRVHNVQALVELHWAGKLPMPPHPVWEGDVTDWEANPYEDSNWQFQHQTLRWMNALRWSALSGDSRSRKEWIRLVRSWADTHIPANKAKNPFAWRDMVDGTRAIALSLGSSLLSSEDEWFVSVLEYHRDWLLDSTHIVGKNHGLHQHLGLFVVSAVLKDRHSMNIAVERMTAQFQSTFDEDGTNDEGSADYHQLNYIWWEDGWQRIKKEGIPLPDIVDSRLSNAAGVLAELSLPNGQLVQIGDSTRKWIFEEASPATLYIASRGEEGQPPNGLSRILAGGYIISRSGWGTDTKPLELQSHTVIRYGEELHSHSHRDRGSVHIYTRGKPWLVDSGFYSYEKKNEINEYLQTQEAHNIAFLPDQPYDPDASVDLIRSTVRDDVHDYTLLDNRYRNSKLERRILYFPEGDFWIVADAVIAVGGLAMRQHWHLEPGTQVSLLDNGFRLSQEGDRFGMYWLGRNAKLTREEAREGILAGWVSTNWKDLKPSVRLVAETSGPTQRLVTLMGPHQPAPIGIVESRVTVKGEIAVTISRGDVVWAIRVTADGVTVAK